MICMQTPENVIWFRSTFLQCASQESKSGRWLGSNHPCTLRPINHTVSLLLFLSTFFNLCTKSKTVNLRSTQKEEHMVFDFLCLGCLTQCENFHPFSWTFYIIMFLISWTNLVVYVCSVSLFMHQGIYRLLLSLFMDQVMDRLLVFIGMHQTAVGTPSANGLWDGDSTLGMALVTI